MNLKSIYCQHEFSNAHRSHGLTVLRRLTFALATAQSKTVQTLSLRAAIASDEIIIFLLLMQALTLLATTRISLLAILIPPCQIHVSPLLILTSKDCSEYYFDNLEHPLQ